MNSKVSTQLYVKIFKALRPNMTSLSSSLIEEAQLLELEVLP